MGKPTSPALRRRHTNEQRAQAACWQVMRDLREADETFSTYEPNSYINRLHRNEVTLADCPPQIAEVLALGLTARHESGGAFDRKLPGLDGKPVLDPSSVVEGRTVEETAAALRALPDTDFYLSAGGDMTCRTRRHRRRAMAHRHRRPARVLAVVPIHTGGLATPAPSTADNPSLTGAPPAPEDRVGNRRGANVDVGRHRRRRRRLQPRRREPAAKSHRAQRVHRLGRRNHNDYPAA